MCYVLYIIHFTSIDTKCLTASSGMNIGDIYEETLSNAKSLENMPTIAQEMGVVNATAVPQFHGTVAVGDCVMVTDRKGDPILRGIRLTDEKERKNIQVIDEEIVMYTLRRIFELSINKKCLQKLVDSTFQDFHKRSYILSEYRENNPRASVWLSDISA